MSDSMTRAGTPPLTLPPIEALPIFTPNMRDVREARVVGFESRSIDARPFNLLRTQVAKKCAANGWTCFGITSAAPAAGKSVISLNLAASLARVGDMPIYLFDFDMTRASIGEYLGIEAEHGIEGFLSGQTADLAATGVRIDGTNLAVFPTMEPVENTAELLASPQFTQLVESFRATQGPHLVICDLPPTFANDDAMIAVQQLDAYMLVVDSGSTTRRQIEESCKMLEPAPRLGAVLNRYQGGLADPYGYGGYRNGYGAYY
ncbi:CpsD/CapB family tyrosine-protein kinase [Sphingomonas floccifaciens]|uniref:CpsD/CapB family tyrosine-protein kinase n=1 Tax=Sphingomonas floccifaciens TaxID=1844115 RepID=A0ABW4N9L2_9SPHN